MEDNQGSHWTTMQEFKISSSVWDELLASIFKGGLFNILFKHIKNEI